MAEVHAPDGVRVSLPVCDCHGVPMYWHKTPSCRLGGRWRCREQRKPLDAERWDSYYYERMPTSVRYGPRYLRQRHQKALKRRRERQLKEGLDG